VHFGHWAAKLAEQMSESSVVGLVTASNRWRQLFFGIICMSMIANLQYGWTLFFNPIHDEQGWSRAAIQVAFTIFIFAETWLVPIEVGSSTVMGRGSS
jgi:OFA family oxalate/formate antiporter-like MFS transporter